MNSAFLRKIRAYADRYDMLPKGGIVLAAVSGGADSVCLLHALDILKEKIGFTLTAVHFNHCLRGAESDGDEAFVAELCDKLGVLLCSGRGDVKGEAERAGHGIEETARKLRYEYFSEAAKKFGASRIATAHTADDNAETVVMNLTRGGAARGLSGIPPVRGILVRPLMCVTRAEVETFILEQSLTYREDSSNASDEYTRNFIRHNVIPLLKDINPSFSGSALQASELLREDDTYLCELAEKFIRENISGKRLPASKLAALPGPVARRVVRALCGRGLTAAHVAAVLAIAESDDPSTETHLPSRTVRREYGDLIFGSAEKATFEPVELSDGVSFDIPGIKLHVKCEKGIFLREIHKSLNTFVFKCDNICGKLLVRPKISGDRAALGGMKTKTLKKLFIEKKIPAHRRASVPVVADENKVLAVWGIGQISQENISAGDEIFIITFKKSCENNE